MHFLFSLTAQPGANPKYERKLRVDTTFNSLVYTHHQDEEGRLCSGLKFDVISAVPARSLEIFT